MGAAAEGDWKGKGDWGLVVQLRWARGGGAHRHGCVGGVREGPAMLGPEPGKAPHSCVRGPGWRWGWSCVCRCPPGWLRAGNNGGFVLHGEPSGHGASLTGLGGQEGCPGCAGFRNPL